MARKTEGTTPAPKRKNAAPKRESGKKEAALPLPFLCAPLPEGETARFDRVRHETLAAGKSEGAGIGTLGEKVLHATMKTFVCENPLFHEVKIPGRRFVADVMVGRAVTEVQTGAFYPMKEKMAFYRENGFAVTVVHPIVVENTTTWLAADGTVEETVKGRTRETAWALLPELYALGDAVISPDFSVRLLFITANDFRPYRLAKNGRRIRKPRVARIPEKLVGEAIFAKKDDYKPFLPPELTGPFKVSEFARHTPLKGIDVYSALGTLERLGLIRKTQERPRTYQVIEE